MQSLSDDLTLRLSGSALQSNSVPVNQSNLQLRILLDLSGGGPAYQRLTHALRSAIRDGKLRAGEALPASRTLAADLGVSRWVVTEAYNQLAAEGYLVSHIGSGTRVANQGAASPESIRHDAELLPVASTDHRPAVEAGLDLRPGLPDLAAFPRLPWVRAHGSVARNLATEDLGYPDPAGCAPLRATIAGYLRRVRGIDAHSDQLVITSSTTHSMDILSRALLSVGISELVVEDPCWPRLPDVAAAQGLNIIEAPLDLRGIVTAQLPAQRAAALVTPAHQFPTGVALDGDRRGRLLEWAQRHGGLIIEDDYDAEFRYDRRPLGALAGLEPELVTYLGSVSKTLAPGLRLAWMLVPKNVLPAVLGSIPPGAGPSLLDQMTLARFIERGDYDRHLRRMQRVYRERRDALANAVREVAPALQIGGAAAGLHMLLDLDDQCREAAVSDALLEAGTLVAALERYRRQSTRAGIVLSYARLPTHHARDAAHTIAAATRGDSR